MAAPQDNNRHDNDRARIPRTPRECLPAAELSERLDEEIARAERHETPLSCLLVSVDDIERLSSVYGEELPERALAYLAAALERQLRRFDRVGCPAPGQLLILLPGADERRAEMVARRALGRLHAVKIELDGPPRPLHVSIGIAQWREGADAAQLLERARLAAVGPRNNNDAVSLPEPS